MPRERRPSDLDCMVEEDEEAGEVERGHSFDSLGRSASQGEFRRQVSNERGRISSASSMQPLEASIAAISGPGAANLSAEFVLRVLAPGQAVSVKARLRREHLQTAADLAGLDKEDLRELGLSMVERSRVLNWGRQAFPADGPRSRSGAGSQDPMPEIVPGTPGISAMSLKECYQRMETSRRSSERQLPKASEGGELLVSRRFSDHDIERFTDLLEVRRDGFGSDFAKEGHDVTSSADFWCRLVLDTGTSYLRADVEQVDELLRRGGEAANQINLGDLRENVLEKLFDLSPERVKEVYETIDRDSDGRILKEELKEGLHRCELHGLDGALEKVLSFVSRDRGSLQLAEFESVLTHLKLAQLLSVPKFQHQAASDQLTILDYNGLKVEERKLSVRDFFFGHRTEQFPMRWVHLRHFDLTLMLALTVKYQLHPLSVEDVIDQAPTKIDHYEGHYFVSIEHLEVFGAINGTEPVKVRGRHVTLFCAGPPHLDTVLTVSQADRSFQQDWPGRTETSGIQEDAWVARLHKRLRAVRSRVRERRADFLMYEIIDLCTDDLRLVTRVYTARLNWLEDRLVKSRLTSEQGKLDWFNEVGLMRLQLAVVARRLRGLQRLLRRLADERDLSPALSGYLQDVADHVNEAYEDAGHLGDKCKTLSEAYEHAEDRAQDKVYRENAQAQTLQDERMNKMLFILTVLTTIFTPLTFVAGLYGMNFQDGSGKPTIPELLVPHGYYYFLIFTAVYLVVSCIIGICLWRRVRHGPEDTAVVEGRRRSSTVMVPPHPSVVSNGNYAALP